MDLFGQFSLSVLYSFMNIEITNSTLFMWMVLFSIVILFYFGTKNMLVVPTKLQVVVETLVCIPLNICKEQLGEKHYLTHAPFVMSFFLFVLFGNLFGLIPYYGFTITSHISVCLALALMVWVYSIILGIHLHGIYFVKLFAPNVPYYILPFVFVIELISFLFKPFTITIRLVANMMIGHVLLKVFAYLVISSMSYYVLAVVPFSIMIFLIPFEIFVSFIQAYVFFLLAVFSIKDAIFLH